MADIEPINQQPLSDDQELAKVLAGVSQQADEAASSDADTPVTPPVSSLPPQDDTPAMATVSEDTSAPTNDAPIVSTLPPESSDTPTVPPMEDTSPAPETTSSMPSMPVSGSGELDSIKKEALGELRPLVDKLNVAPEEKFDTYLLLLRSTDDKELIAPAHEAAKNIPDETRRAQALLDIIKEIDFLSQNGQ